MLAEFRFESKYSNFRTIKNKILEFSRMESGKGRKNRVWDFRTLFYPVVGSFFVGSCVRSSWMQAFVEIASDSELNGLPSMD